MLTGIGLVGVLSATVTRYFVGQRAEDDMTELHRRLDRIEALLTRSPTPDQAAPPVGGGPDEDRVPDREAQSALPTLKRRAPSRRDAQWPSGRGGLRCMR